MATPRASTGGYAAITKKLNAQQAYSEPDANGVARAPIGYGVFAQGLSGALQQQAASGDIGSGGAMAALGNYADQERARIATTSEADRKAAIIASVYPKLFDKLDDKGTLAEVNMANVDPYGLFNTLGIDSDAAIRRRNDIATGHKTEAEALDAYRKGGGTVDTTARQNLFSNPITGTPAAGYGVFANDRTPDEVAAQTTADASMLSANAKMLDAKQAIAVAKAGKPVNTEGMVTVTDSSPKDPANPLAGDVKRTWKVPGGSNRQPPPPTPSDPNAPRVVRGSNGTYAVYQGTKRVAVFDKDHKQIR